MRFFAVLALGVGLAFAAPIEVDGTESFACSVDAIDTCVADTGLDGPACFAQVCANMGAVELRRRQDNSDTCTEDALLEGTLDDGNAKRIGGRGTRSITVIPRGRRSGAASQTRSAGEIESLQQHPLRTDITSRFTWPESLSVSPRCIVCHVFQDNRPVTVAFFTFNNAISTDTYWQGVAESSGPDCTNI
ncbi:uncharacterized protein JN550_005489 [Neoarthrinium moseri]|uniref:uncharacterized protein n=1 Tax=Neoarthrinium moseri TaxID=1658444 RepID=UPI001FDC5909|nr:uncharacterized protein JN550_005489 [Neoarthrinium moseri]KAI1869899.1 hypothetical protein JN550_005489 [Neoarthrinium moseri]